MSRRHPSVTRPRVDPTRRQKRASRPLRTAGALLGLLGGVGIADRLLDLAKHGAHGEPLSHARLPPWLAAGVAAVGVILYWLGRRWQ